MIKGNWLDLKAEKISFIFRFMLICSVIVLAGCDSLTRSLGKGSDNLNEVLIYPNLVDEKCRIQSVSKESGKVDETVDRHYEIYCGRWEHASGSIFKVSDDSSEKTIQSWVKTGWWSKWLSHHAYCDQSNSNNILLDQPALILTCRLRNGGWPYLALITKVEGSFYLADGIPAIEQVLEQGIGVFSGLRQSSSESTNIVTSKYQRISQFSSKDIYSAGHIRSYYRLMKSGQFYNTVKDFKTAADRYREALALQDRALGTDNFAKIDSMMHLALEISNQGRFSEAELLFKRVEKFIENTFDRNQEARFLSYRALHAGNKRNFSEAFEFAHQVTEMRRELTQMNSAARSQLPGRSGSQEQQIKNPLILGKNEAPNPLDMVQSLYIEASMLLRLDRLDEAEKSLGKAKTLLQSADIIPPSWEPELMGLKARIAKARGAQKEQSTLLSNAVSIWEKIAPGERPSVINSLKLGLAYKEDAQLSEAMTAFRQAIQLVKKRSGSLSFDQLMPYFRTGLELAETRPNEKAQLYAELFEAGQLIRSERTTETISRAVARFSATEGAVGEVMRDFQEAQDQRYFLHREYEITSAQPASSEQATKLEQLKLKITAIKQRLNELGIQVQAALPRYNQLIDKVADIDSIFKSIAPDEALVQVLLGTDEGLLFFVKNQTIQVFPIDLNWDQAAEIVSELRAGLRPNANGTLPDFNVKLAYRLYRRLFNPIVDQLDVNHLITIPSGALLSLPFGLLVMEKPPEIKGYDYRQVKWMMKRTAISLLPSVNSFVGLRVVAKESQATKSFIGFADFVPFSNSAVEQASLNLSEECKADPARVEAYRQQLISIPALPITESEVNEISNAFSSNSVDIVLGKDFNDHALKNMPLSDYRILYFATHGVLPTELECQAQPSLVTSLPEIVKGKDDGLLDIEDILGLKLDSELVVLSACNTGGPALESGGESLSGLARAFFFAGARSLIVSHWLAEDTTTSDLMKRMFKKIKAGEVVGWARALRDAQLTLLEDANNPKLRIRSHPLLWAVFTVVGDGAQKGLKI